MVFHDLEFAVEFRLLVHSAGGAVGKASWCKFT